MRKYMRPRLAKRRSIKWILRWCYVTIRAHAKSRLRVGMFVIVKNRLAISTRSEYDSRLEVADLHWSWSKNHTTSNPVFDGRAVVRPTWHATQHQFESVIIIMRTELIWPRECGIRMKVLTDLRFDWRESMNKLWERQRNTYKLNWKKKNHFYHRAKLLVDAPNTSNTRQITITVNGGHDTGVYRARLLILSLDSGDRHRAQTQIDAKH